MTMTEIAKLAGVSVAAVSRYINGGPLSQEKRKLIQSVMEQNGYQINSFSHIIKAENAEYVGVIVSDIDSGSSTCFISGVTKALAQTGYLTILANSELDREKEMEYLSLFQNRQVAGIIMQASVLTPELENMLRNISVPLVVVGQSFRQIPCVFHDDFGAAYELTNLILARGRRKLAYIGVIMQDIAVGQNRRRGVETAIEEFGISSKELLTEICNPTVEAGEEAMKRLLIHEPEIDGVICATDYIAFGAMDALKQAGKRVPIDVSITGMDDHWIGTKMTPKLTTIHFYHKESGQKAAKMLVDMIKHREDADFVQQIMLGYKMKKRDSI